jgi:hypothetical protein
MSSVCKPANAKTYLASRLVRFLVAGHHPFAPPLFLVSWQEGVDSQVGAETSKKIRLIYRVLQLSTLEVPSAPVVKVCGALVGLDMFRLLD